MSALLGSVVVEERVEEEEVEALLVYIFFSERRVCWLVEVGLVLAMWLLLRALGWEEA